MIPSSYDSQFKIINSVVPHAEQAKKNNLWQFTGKENIEQLIALLLNPIDDVHSDLVAIQNALPIDYDYIREVISTDVNTGEYFTSRKDITIGTNNITLFAWFKSTQDNAAFTTYPRLDMTLEGGKIKVELSINVDNRLVFETDNTFTDGVLHSVLAFIDRKNSTIRISVDGVDEAVTNTVLVGDTTRSLDVAGTMSLGATDDGEGLFDGTFFGLGFSLADNLINEAEYLHSTGTPISWKALDSRVKKKFSSYWQLVDNDQLSDSASDNDLTAQGTPTFSDTVDIDTLLLVKQGAYGTALDTVGNSLGRARLAGQGDLEYKEDIYSQILENTTQGTLDEFLLITASKMGVDVASKTLYATEVFPAQVHATVAGKDNVDILGGTTGIDVLLPAGVGSKINVFPDDGSIPFGFAGCGGGGYSSIGRNDNGALVARIRDAQ
jgi:hypothetical protein